MRNKRGYPSPRIRIAASAMAPAFLVGLLLPLTAAAHGASHTMAASKTGAMDGQMAEHMEHHPAGEKDKPAAKETRATARPRDEAASVGHNKPLSDTERVIVIAYYVFLGVSTLAAAGAIIGRPRFLFERS